MDGNKDEVQLRVALYLRVSTEDQVEKYGLDSQRVAIKGILQSRGKLKDGQDKMVLAGEAYEYVDDGVSGIKELDERPAFARLKEDILNAPEGHKPFDIVAVYRIDRFARKLRILMDVLQLFEQYKIEFISASESIDTSTPFGRAMLGIMGVVAELELETIRERTQRGREQAIQEGVFMGAHPPYGYRKDTDGRLITFPEEEKIVKQIFSLFTIEKLSPQKIADYLKDNEILSPDASAVKHGKRKGVSRKTNTPIFWRAERVREILADRIYTGVRHYNKTKGRKILPQSEWKISPHRHKPIILEGIFDLAQHTLTQFADRKVLIRKSDDSSTYLLSGLLKCSHCRTMVNPPESDMMSWTGDRKLIDKAEKRYSHYYHCNRKNRAKHSIICPVVPIPAEPLEEYVIEFVKQLLTNPKAAYEYQQQLASTKLNTKHLEASKDHYQGLLNALPLRRKSLREQHENGIIDTPTLLAKMKDLEGKEQEYIGKIKEIDYQLSQAELSKGYEETFKLYAKKYGKSLDKILNDRQELFDLIHRLIHQVVVYSRPRNESDVIAGRKKEGQFIPDHIDIYLHLPQNLLRELYTQEFGVKSDNLYTRRDSNPQPTR